MIEEEITDNYILTYYKSPESLEQYLAIYNKENKQYLYIDYVNNLIAGKKCYKFTYQDPLPKAMGLAKLKLKDNKIKILDGTAGFTLDSYGLFLLNNQLDITLIEQSEVLYKLIYDGLIRLENHNKQNIDILGDSTSLHSSKLYNINLVDYLNNTSNPYDIIYLDPMFEKKLKNGKLSIKSKPKQNMQLLQDLCENPNSIEELLNISLKYAGNRVVLKRSLKQPKLLEKLINYSVKSKQIRYDVYLT